ncbi:hypothetical protein GCM10023229_01920 [Flavisolibacter ginsenosidimutans]
MESAAVYCSDVMSFPETFEGTKGIVHPDDLQKLSGALQLLADGRLPNLDFRLITTWGEVKALSGENVSLEKSLPTEADQRERWEGPLQQLASLKEAEALKQRTDLADAAEIAHRIGSWAVNKSTGEVWYSDGVYRIHNLPPQSLNAHANTFLVFLHPDDRATVADALEAAYAQEVPVHLEYRIVIAGGEVRTVRLITHWSYTKQGQPLFSGVLRDLSEERQAAAEAQTAAQTAKFHQQVMKFSEHYWSAGYWFVNLVTRKAVYSDNYYRIYGLKQQQLPGYNAFLNLVHPDDRYRIQDLINRMYSEHRLPEAEFRIIRPDGKQRHLKQSGKVFVSGNDLIMIGAVHDVTVQRGLEKKVAELHDKAALQDLVQSVTENLTETGFITWHPEGYVQWSPGLYRVLGYKANSIEALPGLLHRQIHPDDLNAFKDAETLVTNGQPHEGLRFRILNRGGIRQLSISFHRIASGGREMVVGVVQDFTRQAALHQKLTDTTRFGETLSAAISDAVLLTDKENTVLAWNRVATEKTGIKAEEALYSNLFDLFPALNEEAYLKQLQTVMLGSEVHQLKARNLYLKKPHHYYLIPLRDESGETTRVLHVVQDVSRELDLQQQLSERLAFIESLVESSVDRIVVLDKHMNYVYWNKRAEEYYATGKSRVIGRNILEIFPGLRNDPNYNEFRKVLRGETVYLPPLRNAESNEYFETYLVPVKDEHQEVAAILWIVHDLSKEFQLQEVQRKAQEQLAEEHRRLKDAQTIGRVGSFEWNAATNSIHWSDEMYRIHGLEPQSETLTLEKVLSFIHPDDVETSLETLRQSRKEPGLVSMTHRIIRAGGEVRTISRTLQSFAGEDGQVTFLSGTVQDITEQKLAEQQIKEQSNYITRITDTVPDMISVIELATGKTTFLNADVFAANGFDAERMNARSMEERKEIIYPDDRPVLASYFRSLASASDDDMAVAEYRSKTDSGEWRWFSVRGKVFQRNEEGAVTHVLNVIENITRRKKAEEELIRIKDALTQKAADKFLVLFNSIDEGFYQCEVIFDEAGRPVDILYLEENPAAVRIIGQSFVGKTLKQINTGYEKKWFETWGSVVLTGESKRMEQYSKPDQKWFDFYITKIGDKDSRQVAVIFQDVTEQKNAAKALRQSEERLRHFNASLEQQVAERTTEIEKNRILLKQAENIAIIGSWEYEIPLGRFSWSDGMYSIFDEPKGALVQPEIYLERSLEEDRAAAKRIVKQLRKLHQPFEETLRINRNDGFRLLKVKATVVCDEEGKPQKIIGVDKDITGIHNAEEKLAQSQYWLEQTTKATPDAITVYDLEKKEPLYLNDCLAQWTGVPADKLVSMGIEGRLQLIHPDDRLPLLHFNEKIAAANDGKVLLMEYRVLSKDEGIRWLRNRAKVFQRGKNGKVTHILSILQDVTEEKEAGAKLKELNESLEAKNKDLENKNEEITSFAFVASHDLKEPLRKIHTFSDWLLTKEEGISEDGKENLRRLINSVKRLGVLVDDIVALTKVHVRDEGLEDVDLNTVLQTAMSEMQDVIVNSGAEIVAGELPVIKGVENHLLYLFKNLLGNAIKFQPPGNKPVVRIQASRDDKYTRLSFADNGIGFAPEHRKKIFQMFRRLHGRQEYDGTGMGLAICKKIMEKHGGNITAESEKGKGATFVCTFPA